MKKCEVVEMREKPLDILLWHLNVGAVGGNIEFGYVHGLIVGMAQEVEREVEKTGKVVALLDVFDVVIPNFKRLVLSAGIDIDYNAELTACSRWSNTSNQLSK